MILNGLFADKNYINHELEKHLKNIKRTKIVTIASSNLVSASIFGHFYMLEPDGYLFKYHKDMNLYFCGLLKPFKAPNFIECGYLNFLGPFIPNPWLKPRVLV
jgi:hypothetical protein